MLRAIAEYGRLAGLASEPGFGTRGVHWMVHVDKRAKYRRVEDLRADHKPRLFERAPQLSQPILLGGGRAQPRCQFLVETIAVLLQEPADKKTAGRRGFFLAMLERASGSAPLLAVMRRFFGDPVATSKALADLLAAGAGPKESFVVVVAGENPLLSEQWKPWWRAEYASLSPAPEGSVAVDLLDGALVTPTLTHPKVGGFFHLGGAPTGDTFISCGQAAFESYGMEASANAAMSADSAALVAGAIGHLVRHAHVLGQTATIAWTDAGVDDPIASLFGADTKPSDATRFHLLVLSAYLGRVRVRAYRQGCAAQLRARLEQWHDDLELAGALVPNVPLVMSSLYRDAESEMRGADVCALLDCIFDGLPVPESLAAKALALTTHEMVVGDDTPPPRVALLRAFLRRRGRGAPPYLDPDHPDPAYQFGRLLAALVKLQYIALGNVGAGPIRRAYPLALISPAKALLTLRPVARSLARQAPAAAGMVGRIAGALPPLPERWNRQEQALLTLAYDQQRWERTR